MAYSLTYTYTSNAYSVTGFDGNLTGAEVVIPLEHDDGTNGEHPVTEIGELAFSPEWEGSALVSISAESVVNIGNDAFVNCPSLASASFPSATSIGGGAFVLCPSLASVSFPSVTTIGNLAFDHCTSLTSVSFPSVTTIGVEAFNNCTSLTSVSFPSVAIIGAWAFYGCTSLESLTLGATAPTVGDNAFENATPTVYVPYGATGYDNPWVVGGASLTVVYADPAIARIQASNPFNLGEGFNSQSTSTPMSTTNVAVSDANGNIKCQRNITDITNYTQTATYCGTDFLTDAGTFLAEFGGVHNSILLTGMTITMGAGQYASIELTGHQHDTNAHATARTVDVSDFLPHAIGEPFENWDGFGVEDFGVTTGNDCSPASATVTFTVEHLDTNDVNGKHLSGKNLRSTCELSLSFEGTPENATRAAIKADFDALTGGLLGALVDSIDKNDGNSEFDTFSFTATAKPEMGE